MIFLEAFSYDLAPARAKHEHAWQDLQGYFDDASMLAEWGASEHSFGSLLSVLKNSSNYALSMYYCMKHLYQSGLLPYLRRE